MITKLRRLVACFVLMLPVWAQAQILDFDGVCKLPPCPAMSLYAASGITITPTNANVVAGGTDGLTGTNGGNYLYSAIPPYPVAFLLARPATYYFAALSRGASSGGAVTVSVAAFKTGSLVAGPAIVTLTDVNTWSPVSLSVPGGFDQIFIDPSGPANATFGIDNVRISGNCFGFSDVAPTENFCNAAEWLGNRGVTSGCAAGMFCPTNNVTRAQMALFMQHLGAALTPTILYNFATVSTNPFTNTATICSVSHTPTRPSSASAVGTLIANNPPAPAGYQMFLHYSSDGGTTWSDFAGSNNTFATVAPSTSASQTQATPAVNLETGKTYLFAGRVAQYAGPSQVAQFYCYLQVTVNNADPLAAPFDAPRDIKPTSPLH